MDFARNLLKKYGWEEGQGLGKNNNGIVKPLKANLKFDTDGLGLDKGSEFNNQWWKRVFNDAANNIDVNKSEESVSFRLKDKEGVEVSTKDYSINKLKKLKPNEKTKHSNFIKSSILNGNDYDEITNKIETDNLKFKIETKILTDDELFAACGGRTAHKAARHGLNMEGKLKRIEEQEKEFLLQMNKIQENTINNEKDDNNWKVVSNKKKRKSENKIIHHEGNDELNKILYTAEYSSKSKKKRKKDKNIENDLINCMNKTKVSEEKNKEEKELIQNIKKDVYVNSKKQKNKHKSKQVKEENNKFSLLFSENDETIVRNSQKTDEESINKNRTEFVTKKHIKSKDIDCINTKSKSISKTEKRKFKKSLKKINNQIENSLSIF